MLFQKTISTLSFKDWLFKDRENRLLLKWSVVTTIISFTWLKILYLYPNFMPPDSNSYLEAAYNNEFINIWAIGYSKFLRLVSSFTNSHFVLVVVQYLLLQISLLYMLFSIRYLVIPGKVVFRILFGLSVLNPLLPHIANFVSSDSLFTSLSLVWYAQLLWLIYKPSRAIIIANVLILFLAFTVRHNALYYPAISVAVIMITRISKRLKWVAAASILLLIGAFIGFTSNEYYKKTGTFQYSAFGGWQLAANALYGYAYTKLDDPSTVPTKFRPLHKIVNQQLQMYKRVPPFLRPDREVGVFYLWDFQSPLRLYQDQYWHRDSAADFFKKWASMAPLYESYGRYLIAKHPKSFVKNYVWPNLQRYYAPPAQFMDKYNLGNKSVDSIIVKWFGWKNNTLPALGTRDIWIANAFSILTPVINVIFLAGFISFICLLGFKQSNRYNKLALLCTFAVWIINTVFSVISAPIELRYQLFPLIITFVWGVLFIGYIISAVWINPETVLEPMSKQMAV